MRIKLSQNVVDAINQQINNEFSSSYQYLALAAFFDNANLPGFAHWMRLQRQEEDIHAMKLYNFLLEHGCQIDLMDIPKPTHQFHSPLEVFEYVLNHEHRVTEQVFELYELTLAEKAYTAKVQLEWFITEQAEEESSVSLLLEQIRMVQNDPTGLLVLDRELATRTLTALPA